MSTPHLHHPHAEKADALEVALSYMLATVAGVVLWAAIIGAIAICIQGVTASLQYVGLLS